MLGYVISPGRGAGDRLLAAVAGDLTERGLALAGAVQINVEHDPARPCHMDLCILGAGETFRISEDRGRHAGGCRLDPRGLADGILRVETSLDFQRSLLVINKFGKAEVEGGGFREAIGRAIVADIPVLTTVREKNLTAFLDFAGGMATELPPDMDRIVAWCLDAVAARTMLRA